jgi:hypothetical protein
LVRRLKSGGHGSPWTDAVQSRVLTPTSPPCTAHEVNAGIARSVYFFFGCAAYPSGDVAIVLGTDILAAVDSSFWPFDTGFLSTRFATRNGAGLDENAQAELFRAYWGNGDAVRQFAGEFLASHFADALNYIRSGQRGEPDFPPYHGLRSADNDRRSWSIEVQAHDRVSLAPDAAHLKRIVLQRHHLLAELPDDMAGFAMVAIDVCAAVRQEIESTCALEAS